MMTDKQPEALRLADALDELDPQFYSTGLLCEEAAAELRRLHEVETKYHESIGGFKRDLAEKLEQQRKKNERLTDELRRLHEVNAELVEVFKRIRFEQGFACECGIEDATWELIETAIAKSSGEQQ